MAGESMVGELDKGDVNEEMVDDQMGNK